MKFEPLRRKRLRRRRHAERSARHQQEHITIGRGALYRTDEATGKLVFVKYVSDYNEAVRELMKNVPPPCDTFDWVDEFSGWSW